MHARSLSSSRVAIALSVLFCAGDSLSAQDPAATPVPWDDALPPGTQAHAEKALAESSRHGEWVDIAMPDGSKLNSWIMHPERQDQAGVVLVIHDIRGMSDWIRALGDQLAQDGFIAIVPDFLSGKGPAGGGTSSLGKDVGQAICKLTDGEVSARLDAAMQYGKSLPAANGKTAAIGLCRGWLAQLQPCAPAAGVGGDARGLGNAGFNFLPLSWHINCVTLDNWSVLEHGMQELPIAMPVLPAYAW